MNGTETGNRPRAVAVRVWVKIGRFTCCYAEDTRTAHVFGSTLHSHSPCNSATGAVDVGEAPRAAAAAGGAVYDTGRTPRALAWPLASRSTATQPRSADGSNPDGKYPIGMLRYSSGD
jgi:hypothetical protein